MRRRRWVDWGGCVGACKWCYAGQEGDVRMCADCARGTIQLWGGGLGMQHGLGSAHK